MSSSSFRIAFEGEPFAEGEIDVNDLAPALLALGEVIQAANRALNGDRADARLKQSNIPRNRIYDLVHDGC